VTRHRGLRFVVTGGAVVVAVTLVAALARASSPGSNGRIFYMSNGSGSYNIWSVNPDGSDPTQLTTQTSNAEGAMRPSVSGDGSKVSYMQFDDVAQTNSSQIWIMNGNGSGQTQLTTTGNNVINFESGMSPNGSQVAFMRVDNNSATTGYDIWIMNANGSNQTQLTNSTDDEKSPEFSPDGTKIVYVRASGGANQIWLMNANGTNQHALLSSPGVQLTGPSFSPDGQKIVYEDSVNGLSVMNADGSSPTAIHNASGQAIMAQDPTWSPDGTKLAFSFFPGSSGQGIFTVPAAGGANPHQVINLPSDFQSIYPSWAAGPAVMRTLTVSKSGTGDGTVTSSPAGIDCGSTCSAQFADGSQVTLTAVPAAGSTFAGWSGGECSGTGTCPLTLNSDVSVTAGFAHVPPAAPNTKLAKPKISSKKRMATFRFKAVGTATGFRCSLVHGKGKPKFRPCVSPKVYRHLRPGKYTFQVLALNGTVTDKTPAKKRFTIKR
jgi:List-Bact-rpt repeat protein/WD40 repeat protein